MNRPQTAAPHTSASPENARRRRARIMRCAMVSVVAAALTFGVIGVPASANPQRLPVPQWLCAPSVAGNPCDLPLDTTDLRTGTTSTPPINDWARKNVDCFYVYPTVSNQPSLLASPVASPEVKSIARFQAARFTSQCRVFAPVYRQIPLLGFPAQFVGISNNTEPGYEDVLSAWRYYLAHENKGRGVILVGHSQGSLVLRRLIREQLDNNPSLRAKLVGAFLIGGNVQTAPGRTSGGDFRNIPICTFAAESTCVVAYSTTETSPVLSLFGNSALDRLSASFGLPSGPQYQVACTDPAALVNDDRPVGVTVPSRPYAFGLVSVLLDYTAFPYGLPTSSSTWTTSSQRANGKCIDENGYHLYQFHILDNAPAANEIPLVNSHLVDMNLGYDRLLAIASNMIKNWSGRSGR